MVMTTIRRTISAITVATTLGLGLTACGSPSPANARPVYTPASVPVAPSSSPDAVQAGSAAPLSCSTVTILIADERSQKVAQQEAWLGEMGNKDPGDLNNAISASSNAPAGSDAQQFNADASQFLSDNSAGLAPGWETGYDAIGNDVQTLAADCGISYTY